MTFAGPLVEVTFHLPMKIFRNFVHLNSRSILWEPLHSHSSFAFKPEQHLFRQ